MMTEIAAYPASVWALYAMVVALSAPSRKHDLLALLALPLAYLARGELIVLVFVLPLALVVYELGRASGAGRAAASSRPGARSSRAIRSSSSRTPPGALVALVLYAQHRLSSVLGVYSAYSDSAHLQCGRLPRSIVEHLATFSLGVRASCRW